MTVPKAGDNKKSSTVADPIRQSKRVEDKKAKATTVTPVKHGDPVASNSDMLDGMKANLKDAQRSMNEKFDQVRMEWTNDLDQIMQTWVVKFERRLKQNDQKIVELEKSVEAAVHRQDAMQEEIKQLKDRLDSSQTCSTSQITVTD